MMLTLCRNALLSVMAITICSCLPLIAQDNSTPTPTANPDVAAAQELLLESPSKDDSMTFEEVLAQYNENKVKSSLIHFYVEDKYPISTTKTVLKEIAEQFSVLNTKNDSDFFTFNILFEGYDISSIPPPPPPPMPNEFDIEK